MHGRTVTFTGQAVGFVSDQVSCEPIIFNFSFRHSDGTPYVQQVFSYTLTAQTGAVMEKGFDKPSAAHHFWDMVASLNVLDHYAHVATSSNLTIRIYQLYIEYFRHTATGKDWKVCVGQGISYSVAASSDCTNWDWDMDDQCPDAWNPEGGHSKTGADMYIPYEDLARASNSWFGEAYGTVWVSCKDSEDNCHGLYSREMDPPRKAKVFFPPDVNVDGGAPSNEKPPCWFVFWKDGLVVAGIGDFGYDHTAYYGRWDGHLLLGRHASESGDGPRYAYDANGQLFWYNGEGRHIWFVAEVIAHEKYHKLVDETFHGQPDADGDELPDGEEPTPHRPYLPPSDPATAHTFSPNPQLDDEEIRCRVEERENRHPAYPDNDWSADPENPNW
jgi:hypothetical protein